MSAPGAALPTRVVLVGALGRMGRALLALAADSPQLQLVGALVAPGAPQLGQDAGTAAGLAPNGVPLGADLALALERAQVVVDFSRPECAAATLAACRSAGCALLLGTTGYPASLEAQFSEAARRIALLVAPNTSLAVTLLLELAARASAALPGFRAEIAETHHALKRDAPSGTALALKAAIEAHVPAGSVGVASQRSGEVVGEHTVRFSGPGESLELTHRAQDRAIFARGALAAALWLAPRPAGRYAMRDVLS
jgi:4-hydroxy-tetrahydrodipicolinate reductase